MIRVENLGKKYVLSHAAEGGARYGALRDALSDAARAIPKLLMGKGGRPTKEEFWALRDVTFNVNRGDVVGVIGRNGAGKSTLLKVLSRIVEPTAGRVSIEGRVASLLEVGTGFHPELSGRENVYLNGAILGMTRVEIRQKFDEIVAFADVEKFLDTPVKRYSSGMYVRLAFAVAAHLEPEILLVDEVLAVGDAAFQKKCLDKVRSIGRSGRTIFLVSHNIGSVLEICSTAILMDKGRLQVHGPTKDVVKAYYADLEGGQRGLDADSFRGPLAKQVVFDKLTMNDAAVTGRVLLVPNEPIRVVVQGVAHRETQDFKIAFSIFRDGVRLLTVHDVDEPQALAEGPFEAQFELPANLLRPGEYSIALGGRRVTGDEWVWGTDLATFTMLEEWGPGNEREAFGVINCVGNGRRLAPARVDASLARPARGDVPSVAP